MYRVVDLVRSGKLGLEKSTNGEFVAVLRTRNGDVDLSVMGTEFLCMIIGAMVDDYRRNLSAEKVSQSNYQKWRSCLISLIRNDGPVFWSDTQRTVGDVLNSFEAIARVSVTLVKHDDAVVRLVASEAYDMLTQFLPLASICITQPQRGYWSADPTDSIFIDQMAGSLQEVGLVIRRLPEQIRLRAAKMDRSDVRRTAENYIRQKMIGGQPFVSKNALVSELKDRLKLGSKSLVISILKADEFQNWQENRSVKFQRFDDLGISMDHVAYSLDAMSDEEVTEQLLNSRPVQDLPIKDRAKAVAALSSLTPEQKREYLQVVD